MQPELPAGASPEPVAGDGLAGLEALLSVVVVTHQSSAHVAACLESVDAACAGLRHEVLVVDSASTDGTPELIQRAFPRVEFLRLDTNAGYAAALNRGIQAARGDVLALGNADLVLGAGCLRTLAGRVLSEPAVSAAGPVLRNAAGEIAGLNRSFPSLWDEAFSRWLIHRLWPSNPVRRRLLALAGDTGRDRCCEMLPGALLVTTRRTLSAVGPFDESFFLYHEETEWFVRAAALGSSALLVAEAEAVHLGGGSSRTAEATLPIWLRSQCLYHLRTGGFGRLLALAAIHGIGCAVRHAVWSFMWVGGLRARRDLGRRLASNRRFAEHLPGAIVAAIRTFVHRRGNGWYPRASSAIPAGPTRTEDSI